MFISNAYAQAAGGSALNIFDIGFFAPMVMIMAVFYFLLIRPQQKKVKDHQLLLKSITRGDTVVTTGGLIGRVTKVVDDHELQVEIGENVKVRVLRSGISDVRAKGEPAKAVKTDTVKTESK